MASLNQNFVHINLMVNGPLQMGHNQKISQSFYCNFINTGFGLVSHTDATPFKS